MDKSFLQNLSDAQLDTLSNLIWEIKKDRHAKKQIASAQKFMLCDEVSFTSRKGKFAGFSTIVGKIIKINAKTIKLVTPTNTKWNVSPSMLTLVKRG